MEEQLQQSVMVSEDDAYESSASGPRAANAASHKDGDEVSDRDASGEEIEEGDEDAEGEEDNDLLHQQIHAGHRSIVASAKPASEDDDDDEEESDEDGVDLVKLRPESEDEGGSEASTHESEAEDDEGAAWEEEAQEADEEEEESVASPNNVCIFCKQDEENDPSEDFEAYLSCKRCSDHGMRRLSTGIVWYCTNSALAHQQCARETAAMTEDNGMLSQIDITMHTANDQRCAKLEMS